MADKELKELADRVARSGQVKYTQVTLQLAAGVLRLLEEMTELRTQYEALRATAVRCHPSIAESCECRVAGILDGWNEHDRSELYAENVRLKALVQSFKTLERERWGNARETLKGK